MPWWRIYRSCLQGMQSLQWTQEAVHAENDERQHYPDHFLINCTEIKSTTLSASSTSQAVALSTSVVVLVPQICHFSKLSHFAMLFFSDWLWLSSFLKDLLIHNYNMTQLALHFRLKNSFVPDIFCHGLFLKGVGKLEATAGRRALLAVYPLLNLAFQALYLSTVP